jgi:alpha-beta hydrolase superfamily lysophospholipase
VLPVSVLQGLAGMNPARRTWLTVPLVALMGCAAPSFAPRKGGPITAPPALEGAIDYQSQLFTGAGGVGLFEQSWRPQQGTTAALIVVHGLKDHSGRYAGLAEDLCKRGVAVYAFDLRGHGNSEGRRVWVDSFDQYLADLDIFVKRVRSREPGKPLFLFGHSMGGAIVTLYTITAKPQVAGLILSGPALKVGDGVSGFLIGMTRLLSSITPRLAVMKLENKDFSRDPAVVANMGQDPLIYQGAGPARTAAELLHAIARIQAAMDAFDVPVLMLHGTADKLTNPDGSRELSARARSSDKTLKLYGGLYHDLLHEPERAQVMGDLTGWLTAHVPTPPPVATGAPPAGGALVPHRAGRAPVPLKRR